MKRFAGLLFDKDGTLFDFQATWGSWTHDFIADLAGGIDRAGPLADSMGYDLSKRTFRRDSIVIAGSVEEWVLAILKHLPNWDRDALISHIKGATAIVTQVPAAPLDPLLAGLREAGYRLGIATNDGHMPVSRQLKENRIDHHFEFVAGYDSGHGAKPGPGMLLAFAAHLGAPPGDVAMIGDSTHDLEAAHAAGMVPVGVLTGMAEHADLAPFAEIVLPDIGHLPEWLGNPTSDR